jgi:hypothetical protein
MVMPKHPAKTVINSLNPQIFITIDKSTSKNKYRLEIGGRKIG